ncbi:MAG: hypothetical protein WC889_09220, partial [Myxococcota bacterium]
MASLRQRILGIIPALGFAWPEVDDGGGPGEFDDRASQLTVGGLKITAVTLLALIILAWPTDLLIFPVGSPGMRAIFWWRICLIAACLTGIAALTKSRFFRSHPYYVAFLAFTLPVCATGWLMGSIGGLEFPTTYGIYTAPLMTVLLVVGLKARIVVTISLVATYFLCFVAANPAVVADPHFGTLIVWSVASSITAIIAGHVVYFLLRANFRQRQDLDRLAAQLKTLIG